MSKSYRGRGISRELSERVIETAASKGMKKVVTKVRVLNKPMIKSNETLGFVPEGPTKTIGYTTFVKYL